MYKINTKCKFSAGGEKAYPLLPFGTIALRDKALRIAPIVPHGQLPPYKRIGGFSFKKLSANPHHDRVTATV